MPMLNLPNLKKVLNILKLIFFGSVTLLALIILIFKVF